MTSEQRAQSLYELFLQYGWVKEEDQKAISEGIELAITAAVAEVAQEAELHRCKIERMAEERHLCHSSPGREDRFWGCSRGPCKAAAEYLRGLRPWCCAARRASTAGGNDPQDCDWPFCGCDPAASRVLEAIEESGRFAEAGKLKVAREALANGFTSLEQAEIIPPIVTRDLAVTLRVAYLASE